MTEHLRMPLGRLEGDPAHDVEWPTPAPDDPLVISITTWKPKRYLGFSTDCAIIQALDEAGEAGPAIGHP